MQDIPVDLLKQIHPVYGGAIGFGFWVMIQCWRAYREFKREQAPNRPPVARERARVARLDTGFAALDASRDSHIVSLNRQVESLNAELTATNRRHKDELDRLDARLAAKSRLIVRLEEDRDHGWDLARECHGALRSQRHAAHDLAQAAFSAGKFGLPLPSGLPEIPSLESRRGQRPPESSGRED